MMSKKMLTQVNLVSGVATCMTTWLDADSRIKMGAIISLKGDERKWQIVGIFDTLPESAVNNHGWDNNDYTKHEGLFK